MARSFGRILSTIWNDPDWRALTRDAQWLYTLVLSQPKLTLAGVIDFLPARWETYAAGTRLVDIEAALDELEAARFVVIDRHTHELLVRSFARHDVVGKTMNSNLVKGYWSAWAGIQSPILRSVAVDNTPEALFIHKAANPPAVALQMRRSEAQKPASEPALQRASERATEPSVTWNRHLEPSPGTAAHTDPDPRPPADPSPPPARAAAAGGEEDPEPRPVPVVDMRRALVQEACGILTERHMARHASRGNPARHRAAVHAGKLADHRQTAMAIIQRHPAITATELADRLEHPSASPTRPSPLDDTAAAQSARIARHTDPCDTCAGTTYVLDAADVAQPCPACRPQPTPPPLRLVPNPDR